MGPLLVKGDEICHLAVSGASEERALTTQVENSLSRSQESHPSFNTHGSRANPTNYVRSWPVYDLTAAIALEAIRGLQRYQLSYWDSLIWATAKMNQVSNVLSEDFSDGLLLEGVRFLNPFKKGFDLNSLKTIA